MKQGFLLIEIAIFTTENLKNKTMKNLTFIAMMAMALSLGACSTDDDEETKVLSFTLTTEEVLSDSLTIGWDAIPGAAIYDLHLTNQDGSDIRDESSILKTFDFTKLFAGTEYTFTIKAYDASNNLLSEMTEKYTTQSLPEELIGKWEYVSLENKFKRYTLNDIGSGTYSDSGLATPNEFRWKTYTKTENSIPTNYIKFTYESTTEDYTYEINSKTKEIKIGGNSYVNVN